MRTKIIVCIGTPDEKFIKQSWLKLEEVEHADGLEWIHEWIWYLYLRTLDTGTLMHELFHLFQDITVFEDKDEREFAAYLFEDVVNRLMLLEHFKPIDKVKDFYMKEEND